MNGVPAQGPITVVVDADLEPLVPGFLARRREERDRFRDALAAADVATLEAMGHALKGTGGGYGFDHLTDLGRQIELASRAGELAAVTVAVDRLIDYLDRVRVEFR